MKKLLQGMLLTVIVIALIGTMKGNTVLPDLTEGIENRFLDTEGAYQEGGVFVKIKNTSSRFDRLANSILGEENLFEAISISSSKQIILPEVDSSLLSLDSAESYEWYYLEVDDGKTVEDVLLELGSMDSVVEAEPNYIYSPQVDGEYFELASEFLPSNFNGQYYLNSIDLNHARESLDADGYNQYGDNDIIVAVIDSGIDYTHIELAGSMWNNPGEIANDGIDNDANGYIDDYYGVDTVSGDGDPMDDNGHGTHVAGIIAADATNGIGIEGIASNVRLMAIKAGNNSGFLTSADIVAGVNYAYENGADVINMSFGSYSRSILLEDALGVAFNQAVLIAAAGNDDKPNEDEKLIPGENFYPAAYPFVVGVMASDQNNKLAAFSNFDFAPNDGNEYEVVAPGVGIYSTLPNNKYAAWSGTSMSAPIVSGMAALLKSKFNDEWNHSNRFIMGQIIGTANDVVEIDAFTLELVSHESYSLINISNAINNVAKPDLAFYEFYIFDSPSISDVNDGDGIIDSGETIHLGITILNRWGRATNTLVSVDTESFGGVSDPYIDFTTDSVNYGTVGSYSTDDNNYIYTEGSMAIGIENPFVFTVDENTPNDYKFKINVSMNCNNGYDPDDSKLYEFNGDFTIVNQNGESVPTVIDEDMTLTNDTLWIIERSVVIEEGVTVNVDPGTQIQFWATDQNSPYGQASIAYLQVEGTLNFNGTEADPVDIFTSKHFDSYKIEIKKMGNGQVFLDYTTVQNPQLTVTEVSHSYFNSNTYDFYRRYYYDNEVRVNQDKPYVKADTISYSRFFSLTGYRDDYQFTVDGVLNGNLFDSCNMLVDDMYATNNVYLNNFVYEKFDWENRKVWTSEGDINDSIPLDTLDPTVHTIFKDNESGHTYIAVSSSAISRNPEAFATELGGYLAHITSEEEFQFILSNIGDLSVAVGLKREGFGPFEWTLDPTNEYSNWHWYTEGRLSTERFNYAVTYRNQLYPSVGGTFLIEIPGEIYVEDILLAASTMDLGISSLDYKIPFNLNPYTADKSEITFESMDASILTVDIDGFVTPVSLGTTQVVLKDKYEEVLEYLTINIVEDITITGVELSKETYEMSVGSNYVLTYNAIPSTTTDKTLVWTTSNESVVIVDDFGMMSAVGVGTAIISVTNPRTGVTDSVEVTTVKPLERITLSDDFLAFDDDSEDYQLLIDIYPIDATNGAVEYVSSDPTVATVSDTGLIDFIGPGNVVIRVKSLDGVIYDDIMISVSEELFNDINIVDFAMTTTSYFAVTDTGDVWTWSESLTIPQKSETLSNIKMIAAYSYIVYGLTMSGEVVPISNVDSDIEESLLGLQDIVTIDVYNSTLLAVDSNGRVWGVGDNNHNKLGYEGEDTENIMLIQGFADKIIIDAISLDDTTVYLTDTGNVYILGGSGEYTSPHLINEINNIVRIVKTNAAGYNDDFIAYDEFGNRYDVNTDYNSSEIRVNLVYTDTSYLSKTMKDIQHYTYSTSKYTAMLMTDNTLYTYGINDFGRLGYEIDETITSANARRVELDNVVDFFLYANNIYAITSDGDLYAWGRNYKGSIPTVVDDYTSTPTKILFGMISDDEIPYIIDITPEVDSENNLPSTIIEISYNEAVLSSSGFSAMTVRENGVIIPVRVEHELNKLYIYPLDDYTFGSEICVSFGYNFIEDYYRNKAASSAYCFNTAEFINVTREAVRVDVNEATYQLGFERNNEYIESLTFTSSDEAIFLIDNTGLITPVSLGTGTVTISSADGNYTLTVEVDVVDMISITSLDMTLTTLEMYKGRTVELTTDILPVDATETILYSSNDMTVVTVDDAGQLVAVGLGTATITVENEKYGITDTLIVTVLQGVDGIDLGQATLALTPLEDYYIIPTLAPLNADINDVIWMSTDASIAYVDNNNQVQMSGTLGNVVLRAITTDGQVFDQVYLSVVAEKVDVNVVDAVFGETGTTSVSMYILMDDGTVWNVGKGPGGGNTNLDPYFPEKMDITDVIQIRAYRYRVIALKSDGTVWSLGTYNGENTSYSSSFVQVTSLDHIIDIAIGSEFSIALKDDGTVWGWGINNNGVLGDPTDNVVRYTPVQVNALFDIVDIEANMYISYFINSSGEVYHLGDKYTVNYLPERLEMFDNTIRMEVQENERMYFYTSEGKVFNHLASNGYQGEINLDSHEELLGQEITYVRSTGGSSFFILADGSAVSRVYSNSYSTGSEEEFVPSTWTYYDIAVDDVVSIGGTLTTYQTIHYAIDTAGDMYVWGMNGTHVLSNPFDLMTQYPTYMNFNATEDDIAPSVVETNIEALPLVPLNQTIVLTYDDYLVSGYNFGLIQMTDSNGANVSLKKTFDFNTITLEVIGGLQPNETYTITLPERAVEDLFANESLASTIEFSTEDGAVPTLSPSDKFVWNDEDIETIHETFVYSGVLTNFKHNAILNNLYVFDTDDWMRFEANAGENISFMTENFWGTDEDQLITYQLLDNDLYSHLGNIITSPFLVTPLESMYPFVYDVIVSTDTETDVRTVGAGDTSFTVKFNRDMDQDIPLNVFFGPDYPYTDYKVPGTWVDSKTWVGNVPITPLTGDGKQYFRIRDGVAADDGWLEIGDDDGRFMFEIASAGLESLNLQASGSEGRIELSWVQDEFELLAGFNVYRSDEIDGDYIKINTHTIPYTELTYTDYSVIPGQVYYYKFAIVKTDMIEGQHSNIASASAYDTILPTLIHNPVVMANAYQDLYIKAEASDNLALTTVKLYYRETGTQVFNSSDMVLTQAGDYLGIIPGSLVKPVGIDYYILVSDSIAEVTSGTEFTPHQVTVNDHPIISTITPNKGLYQGGDIVTITGVNFREGMEVFFSEVPGLNVVFIDTNTIQVEVPAHYPTLVDVKVVNPSGDEGTYINGYEYYSDDAIVQVPTVKGGVGHEIIVPIQVNNIDHLMATDFRVTYDANMLALTAITVGNITHNFSMVYNEVTPGDIYISMATATSIVGGGDLVYLYFTILEGDETLSDITLQDVSMNNGSITTQVTNGLVEKTEVYQLDGHVTYFANGSIVTGIDFTLEGSLTHYFSTDENGRYVINELIPDDYTLTGSKTDDYDYISAYDAALILRAAVMLDAISDTQKIAADVNNDGSVNSMDASLVLQYVAGLRTLPFDGSGQIWRLIELPQDLTGLSSNMNDNDLTAVLIGDISGNYGEITQTAIDTDGVIKVGEVQLLEGNLIVPIDVKYTDFDLLSIETTISYPTTLELLSVTFNDDVSSCFNVVNTNNLGEVRIALACTKAISNSDNFVTLEFKVLDNQNKHAITLTNTLLNEYSNIVETFSIYNPSFTFDVNADGVIDALDLNVILAHYNETYNYSDISDYDFNNDGIIDLLDIVEASKNQEE